MTVPEPPSPPTQHLLELAARVGYASKGLVYLALGAGGLGVALGLGGTARGTRGTLQLIQNWPLGRVLVFALWQMARGLLDVTDKGDGVGGLLKRAGYVLSGAANIGLSWFALRLALNIRAAQQSTGPDAEDAARVLLDLPGGALFLGAVGLVVTGLGLGLVYTGLRSRFMSRVTLDGQAGKRERFMQALGQIGIAARGLLLGAIGAAVVRTALKDVDTC